MHERRGRYPLTVPDSSLGAGARTKALAGELPTRAHTASAPAGLMTQRPTPLDRTCSLTRARPNARSASVIATAVHAAQPAGGAAARSLD